MREVLEETHRGGKRDGTRHSRPGAAALAGRRGIAESEVGLEALEIWYAVLHAWRSLHGGAPLWRGRAPARCRAPGFGWRDARLGCCRSPSRRRRDPALLDLGSRAEALLSENTCTLVHAAQGRSRRALRSGQREARLVSAVRICAQRRGSGTRQRCLASGGAVGNRRWGTFRVDGGDHWPRSRRWRWLSVAATIWCTRRMRLPLAVWS
ncbi:vegetative cell wall protein gp1-like [Iris pallida]|uniref:Vegetative cell wall protein gp1-like n=1 Tax=Iris pallida TaxID=29817 RepID=A0AAX6H2A4_IRIPA|nr:vegetative cell wall protein gp1-like [Iris pallida]